jgi:hypothetical protein
MQIITAGMLHKLLKADGNEAAELLIYDIKTAGIARTLNEIRERPLVYVECGVWFRDGMARKARILDPLV